MKSQIHELKNLKTKQMSKNLKLIPIMLLLILAISTVSCKKDKDLNTINPRQTILDSIDRDFTQTTSNGSGFAVAAGYEFRTTKKGVINQLVLSTPSIGLYKIVIENTDTNAKDSVSIDITASDVGKTIYNGITPMIANADDDFRITFNDLDKPQYLYSRVGGMAQTYGDIKLQRYLYQQLTSTSSTINGAFFSSIDYTFGGIGFTFEKD
jgi:hypothetical protein